MNRFGNMLWILVLFLGCSSMKNTKIETVPSNNRIGIINESFDPLLVVEDELNIKKSASDAAKSDLDESFLKGAKQESGEEKEISGYRVQICAVSNEEMARGTQRDAILKFNENVYLIFDSPYYKVRVGDCVTRFEADELQKLIIEKGFVDAWVVKTKVKPTPKPETGDNFLQLPSEKK